MRAVGVRRRRGRVGREALLGRLVPRREGADASGVSAFLGVAETSTRRGLATVVASTATRAAVVGACYGSKAPSAYSPTKRGGCRGRAADRPPRATKYAAPATERLVYEQMAAVVSRGRP